MRRPCTVCGSGRWPQSIDRLRRVLCSTCYVMALNLGPPVPNAIESERVVRLRLHLEPLRRLPKKIERKAARLFEWRAPAAHDIDGLIRNYERRVEYEAQAIAAARATGLIKPPR